MAAVITENRRHLKELLVSERLEFIDEQDLLRWLTARNFNPEKAAEMYKKHVAWRGNFHVDTILNDYTPPEVCVKYFAGNIDYVVGHDKEGSMVRIVCVGKTDNKGILHSVKKSDLLKYAAYILEGALDESRQIAKIKGPKAQQLVIIADMDGFGLDQFWKPGYFISIDLNKFTDYVIQFHNFVAITDLSALDLHKKVLALMEANYPEIVKRLFFINGKYQSELLKYIDADQLPVHYGGTKRGPGDDPKCSDVVCYAGKVPTEYYTKIDAEKLEGFTEISVNHGASIELEFPVRAAQSVLSWQFVTEGFDVGFGVLLKTQEGQAVSDMTVVKETERVSSHIVPEDGHITCDVAGTYVLRFDNSYSWARAKKILYTVDILEPSDEIEILECTRL